MPLDIVLVIESYYKAFARVQLSTLAVAARVGNSRVGEDGIGKDRIALDEDSL